MVVSKEQNGALDKISVVVVKTGRIHITVAVFSLLVCVWCEPCYYLKNGGKDSTFVKITTIHLQCK